MRTKNSTPKAGDKEGVSIVSEIEAFLRLSRREGPWRLTIMPPDRSPISRLFDSVQAAALFAAQHDGRSNVYHQANPVRPGVDGNKAKLKKSDMGHGDRLWADFDPAPLPANIDRQDAAAVAAHWAKQRDHVLTFAGQKIVSVKLPPASVTLFSGGGAQCIWILSEPYDLTDLAQLAAYEDLNRRLAELLGADSVQNADRVLRVAGTMNLPDEPKRKDGRIPARAMLMPGSIGTAYARADFLKVLGSPNTAGAPTTPQQKAGPVDAAATPIEDITELERWSVPPLCAQVIAHGHDPEFPLRWPSKKDPTIADKSAAVWHVVCELARREVPDGIVLGILTDARWPISAHVRVQKGGADRYAREQLRKAKVAVSAEARKQAAAAKGFITDDNGNIRKDERNVAPALRELGVELSYDMFANKTRVTGVPGYDDGELDDAKVRRLQMVVLEKYGFKLGKDSFLDVVLDLARHHSFHPVCDFLDGLTWDGEPRLDNWLIAYAGAEDTELNRAFSRIVLMAAVRRVRQPGCKFDELLTLIGAQGAGKSTLISVLAVREEWFTDDLRLDADSKEVLEVTAGKWFVEYGELTGLRKADRDKVKSKLSRRVDKARQAFERFAPDVPRQSIPIGTTNDKKFLTDDTGNRRYWPVEVGCIDLEALRRDRDQLWAEAAACEASGESIRLSPDLYDDVRKLQEERLEEPPMLDDLEHHLGRDRPGWITSVDAWKLAGKRPGTKRRQDQIDFGAAMRRLGFDNKGGKAVFRSEGKVLPGWYRGTIGAHDTSRIAVSQNSISGEVLEVTFPDLQMELGDAVVVSDDAAAAYQADAEACWERGEDGGWTQRTLH